MEKTIEGFVILNANKGLWSTNFFTVKRKAEVYIKHAMKLEWHDVEDFITTAGIQIVPATAVFKIKEEKDGI